MGAGVGNFVNTLVLLILFLCYDTWHPLNFLPNGRRANPKSPAYVTARLDGVRPPKHSKLLSSSALCRRSPFIHCGQTAASLRDSPLRHRPRRSCTPWQPCDLLHCT